LYFGALPEDEDRSSKDAMGVGGGGGRAAPLHIIEPKALGRAARPKLTTVNV
jgi:hypothetical protein